MCLSVCPAPRVLPLRAMERPTEGTYGFGAICKYGVALFKSYGVKTLYVLTATSYARAQAFENAHALTTMCEYTEGCGAKTETRTAVYNVD